MGSFRSPPSFPLFPALSRARRARAAAPVRASGSGPTRAAAPTARRTALLLVARPVPQTASPSDGSERSTCALARCSSARRRPRALGITPLSSEQVGSADWRARRSLAPCAACYPAALAAFGQSLLYVRWTATQSVGAHACLTDSLRAPLLDAVLHLSRHTGALQ
ncbi:hypothetical protein HPB50_019736 [Hyalomma asiaticum]|uniref:Uncharacterized protein n=1 Tax=Hyalomma asiaticum TaxID=266040 RepID=A0ACB7TKF9_HYAAI|nr:hypothetical protein HPB50_019736 [Hyalomma asiaticum]